MRTQTKFHPSFVKHRKVWYITSIWMNRRAGDYAAWVVWRDFVAVLIVFPSPWNWVTIGIYCNHCESKLTTVATVCKRPSQIEHLKTSFKYTRGEWLILKEMRICVEHCFNFFQIAEWGHNLNESVTGMWCRLCFRAAHFWIERELSVSHSEEYHGQDFFFSQLLRKQFLKENIYWEKWLGIITVNLLLID